MKTLVLISSLFLIPLRGWSADFQYSKQFSARDYGFYSGSSADNLFDRLPAIELSASASWGSSCGRMDLTSNLKATLNSILNLNKFFSGIGNSILGAAPMLAICYLSPTWCAILKHGQISAQLLSQIRLNQCSLIDRYVDSRIEEGDRENQACMRREIEVNGRDINQAIESCSGGIVDRFSKWAGAKQQGDNKVIESSAQWAGFTQDEEGRNAVNLLKDLVGDLVPTQGHFRLEYGSRSKPLSPQTYLGSLQDVTHESLCQKLVKRVVDRPDQPAESLVSSQEIRNLSPKSESLLLDWQTLRSLAAMYPRQRKYACKKLSDAIAMSQFSTEMNRSLDVLTTLAQNPNLPDSRRRDLETKRKALKESIEMTVSLRREKNDPLTQLLTQINEEGEILREESLGREISRDDAIHKNSQIHAAFFDCADGVMCDQNTFRR